MLIPNLSKTPTQSASSRLTGTNPDIASQVSGTRFQDILNANPYNSSSRQQSFWERVLSGLGFRTGFDKDIDQLNMASAEYQAQVAQLASEEAYNSPSAQAARMRAAGLNPDLTGVSGEPASEFDNQQQSPDFAGSDMESISSGFQNLSSLVFGALGTAESIFKSVVTVKQMVQDLRSGSLDQAQSVFDTVSKLHGVIMGDESITKDNIEFNPQVNALLGIIPNKKMRKTVLDYLIDYDQSLQKRLDSLNAQTNVANKRVEYNSILGSHTYSDNDETMQGLFKILSDGQYEATTAMYEAEKAKYNSEKNKSDYEGKVYENLNESGAYSTEATSYRAGLNASTVESNFKVEQIDIQRHILNTYKKALDFLHEQAQKGDLFSGILSFALGNMSVDWKSMLTGTIPGYNAIRNAGKYIPQFIRKP